MGLCYASVMSDEPGIYDVPDTEADQAAMRRAEEDIAAGRMVPHAEVARWLRTWGTPDEEPMPQAWAELR